MKPTLFTEIRLGDLADQRDLDAIVIPTLDQLILTGALGDAIRNKAGGQIDLDAQKKGPIKVGEAISTGAGSLPNLYLIYAVVIGTDSYALELPTEEGTETSSDAIAAATLSGLTEAERLGLDSVGFPPVGVDLAGFPVRRCADIMLDQISAYAATHVGGPIRRVVIVCATEDEFREFDRRTIQRIAS
jgi:O-acetyl-ADP-ribose deacetylase (regulator of RNase III)